MKRYDLPKKNIIREMVISFFNKRINKTKQLITLETSDWLFQKQMPKQKLKIYQNDIYQYLKMFKKCPKNVKLKFGDINKGLLKERGKSSGIYLDYCNTYRSNKKPLMKFFNRNKMKSKSPFGVTFCLRSPQGDRYLEKTFKNDFKKHLNHKISFPYKDLNGAPMVTMLFEVK